MPTRYVGKKRIFTAHVAAIKDQYLNKNNDFNES